jgi:hypothetical protein
MNERMTIAGFQIDNCDPCFGGHHRRTCNVALAKVDEPAMLRVQAEHEVVSDANLAAEHRAGAREWKDHVVFAAAAIDCDRARDELAWRCGRPDRNLAEDQLREFRLSSAQFPPGDIAIAVGIEAVGQIEITNCEFELTRDVIIIHGRLQEPIALGMRLDASGGKKRC